MTSEAEARRALATYEAMVHAEAYRLKLGARYGAALDREDLYAEGRVAVLEALERYEGFGVDERTWVRVRVRQRMLDVLRRFDLLSRDEEDFLAQRGRWRASGEDLEERERARLLQARALVSFDGAGFAQTERDASVDEEVARRQLLRRIARGITMLPSRQRTAMELMLYEGLLLREIGERMGITEAGACYLQRCAVERLRLVLGRYGKRAALKARAA